MCLLYTEAVRKGNALGRWRWAAGVHLTIAAVCVLGYHPCAEDGGIYLAEIKHLLDPSLYTPESAFVTGHLGPSLFAGGAAWLARRTGMAIEWVLLLTHILSIATLLFAAWRLAVQCFAGWEARAGAVGLVALCMGMPVAGTSLMLMDPYLTARSIAMPLTVLALAFLLEKRWIGAACALALATAIHPLMGAFGLGEALVLLCLLHPRRAIRTAGLSLVALAALAAAWAIQATAAPESTDYIRIAVTRYYWFLARWQWYEWMGLLGPMAILGWVAFRHIGSERTLARMALGVGALGIALAAAFAREGAPVHAVARLQPLRCFQMVYLLLLIVLGAMLGERLLRRSPWRWAAATLLLGGSLFAVQRATYPASDHLELPGMAPRNAWEQAFLWINRNTPRNALFALDADYVHSPGEDAHGFRALAERSALPDYSKDGGQASIRPELTAAWVAGQRAQTRLTQETDAERRTALRGTGVSWLVLGAEADTHLPCPYRTATILVCRLP